MEHMLNVQIARNSQEDVQKQKLKNSLEIILMEVNGKLYDMIKEFIDGNESADTNLTNDKMFAFPKRITDENSNINAVGIDLGTSRCCVAVNRKSGIETVGLENTGERLLPSYVAYDEDNTKCGQVVADRLRNYSKATVFDSKRMIGKSMVVIDKIWPFKVVNIDNQVMIKLETDRGEIQQTAIQVASELLKYMKIKTEQFQGKRLSEVVITVPAAFTTSQEEATRAAAILAGWETVTLLPEPIAASFAYFIDRPIPNNSTLILFDLGGGTLDVCVFKIINNRIQIISKNGDSRLGGRDFDNLLMDHFINKLSLDYDVNVRGNTKYKLLAECQKIKHYLSVRNDEQ
uniref:Heat shock protein 70 n=1 Tax=Panagrolaimus superbus TaxID=310955 RepID=A0A914XXM3_9BILA